MPRAQMGSVDATPAGDPLRVAFDRLHQYSVRLESAVLFSGFAALFLTARQKCRTGFSLSGFVLGYD